MIENNMIMAGELLFIGLHSLSPIKTQNRRCAHRFLARDLVQLGTENEVSAQRS